MTVPHFIVYISLFNPSKISLELSQLIISQVFYLMSHWPRANEPPSPGTWKAESHTLRLSCIRIFLCCIFFNCYLMFSFISQQTRSRRHRGTSAAAVQSFSSMTRRTSSHRAAGAGRSKDGAGSTPEEPSRTTRMRKTIRMMRLATFGSSAPFYSAISRPGNAVNSAQIWSHSNVSFSSSYLGSSPSFGSWTWSRNPCLLSKCLSSVNLNWPLAS